MRVIFDGDLFAAVGGKSVGSCDEHEEAVIFKDEVTKAGKPAALLTFVVQVGPSPDLPTVPMRVGMVMSVRTLLMIAAAARGRYAHVSGLTDRTELPPDAPETIRGHVGGVGYDAAIVERCYLGVIERPDGTTQQVVCSSEAELRHMAEGIAKEHGYQGEGQ